MARPSRATALLLALAALVALAPRTSRADEATDREEAKQLRDRGVEAMNGGRYAEALEWFQHSYERYPSAKMRYNLAVALDKVGRSAAAVEQYEDFLAANTDGAAARAHATARIAALEPSVARLDVEVEPPDATLWIDARPLAQGRRSGVAVAPGTVLLAAEHPGHVRSTLTLTLSAGERRQVTLAMVPSPQADAEPRAATTAPSPLVAAAPPAPRRPLYRKGWFWGVIGGGAAVAAGAIALGVVFGGGTRYPTPSLGGLAGN